MGRGRGVNRRGFEVFGSSADDASQSARNGDAIRGWFEDCTRAIKLDPRHATAHNNRGAALYKKGDAQGALENFSRAIELEPRYADAYANRATARRRSISLRLGQMRGATSSAFSRSTITSARPPSSPCRCATPVEQRHFLRIQRVYSLEFAVPWKSELIRVRANSS